MSDKEWADKGGNLSVYRPHKLQPYFFLSVWWTAFFFSFLFFCNGPDDGSPQSACIVHVSYLCVLSKWLPYNGGQTREVTPLYLQGHPRYNLLSNVLDRFYNRSGDHNPLFVCCVLYAYGAKYYMCTPTHSPSCL